MNWLIVSTLCFALTTVLFLFIALQTRWRSRALRDRILQLEDEHLRWTASERIQEEKILELSRSESALTEKLHGTERQLSEMRIRCETLEEQARSSHDLSLRLESESKALQEQIAKERELLKEAREALHDSFRSLANQALEGNTKQFIELAKATLAKEAEVMRGDFKQKQQAIDELMRPLHKVLEDYQKNVTEMERERQRSYSVVEQELRRVVETGARLSEETNALKNALRRPHVRGRWGEVQLRNCIDLAGMSEYCDVSFQDSSTLDGKTLRPDMTVTMPGGRVVVVDAKTPLEAFLSSLEATTDEERGTEMLRHGQQVREHVRKLSQKAYNEHLKETADFTVMFLPNESFLYAALETQPDLVEYALEKKILIATPPTLVGLLKVIRYGWQEEKMTQNARAISEAGKELHKRVADFVEAFVNIGRSLDKAKNEYDVGLKRLNSRVLVQARRMEILGARGNKELPEDMGHEDSLIDPEQLPEPESLPAEDSAV